MPSDPLDGSAGEAALPERLGLAHKAETDAIVELPRWRGALQASAIAAYTFAGLFPFVLALQPLKSGAGGLKPVLKALDVHGSVKTFGFGWMGAYTVMSGSPVAVIPMRPFS